MYGAGMSYTADASSYSYSTLVNTHETEAEIELRVTWQRFL